jgi:hypothetical protein
MAQTKVKLIIADTLITLESRFPLEELNREEKNSQFTERFNNFFYKGNKKSDILIDIEVVNKLPRPKDFHTLFITYHPEDKIENWRILRRGNTYAYISPVKNKRQVMFINGTFNKVKAYLLPKKKKGFVWDIADIIYDFLQVLLINYFAQRKSGIFAHAVGIKDLDRRGFLFAGRSGCGKSTSARIWHKYSKAMVLNDDRIIVRKLNGKFFIHGSPWHGDFNDYLASHIEPSLLYKLFFIYHSPINKTRSISPPEAFGRLYPAIFPTFWDKGCLGNIISFSEDLIENVPCYSLGFVNNKKVIEFVRKI